jgi:hypothetical protein
LLRQIVQLAFAADHENREEKIHLERNPVVLRFKKLVPVTSDYREDKFFIREHSVRMGYAIVYGSTPGGELRPTASGLGCGKTGCRSQARYR